MVKTSWPFVERARANEEVTVGHDVVGNMGTLTKVEIFSSLFRPQTLSVKGDRVRGIIAENRRGEYFYHALFENVHEGLQTTKIQRNQLRPV